MPLAVTTEIDNYVATLRLTLDGSRFGRVELEELSSKAVELRDSTEEVYSVVVVADPDFGIGWSDDVLAEDASSELSESGMAFEALAAIPQPIVAAITGQAQSAGLELALACDIRVAGKNVSFGMPETGLGMVPRGGGTQRLPRVVGRAPSLRMLLTGEPIDAAEAFRIGLVSEVVEDNAVETTALDIARIIASRGPIATRFAKEAVLRGVELPLADALLTELDMTVILQTTADRVEGVRAFAEKREPRFENR